MKWGRIRYGTCIGVCAIVWIPENLSLAEQLGILISCEHGGNRVPKTYARLFRNRKRLLASHRGFDVGSLPLARRLARELHAPLVAATVTRLLVDLNRSLGHPHLFSEITRGLSQDEKDHILARHYFPYRDAVEKRATASAAGGKCTLHLSVHSFTPALRGTSRITDVGLLYDPARRREKMWCRRIQTCLRALRPDLRVHRNAPYWGSSDGLTTALRRRLPKSRYVGIELEVNQRLIINERNARDLEDAVAQALCKVLLSKNS